MPEATIPTGEEESLFPANLTADPLFVAGAATPNFLLFSSSSFVYTAIVFPRIR
jgi:hypothetical protein